MSYTFVNFLSDCGLHYRSISRLDVCYDCNDFAGGMSPRRLINSFLSGKFLKNSQPRYSLEADTQSDKRDHIADAIISRLRTSEPQNDQDMRNIIRTVLCESIKRSDDSRCKIQGSAKQVRDINYVTFGSGRSPVSTKIYNKTKEMREVKEKHYISQLWNLNGIDTTRDVWRVEISIRSDARTMLHLSTGELFTIDTDSLRLQADIEDIFYTFAAKYFDFRINDLTANKTRMMSVKIFERMPEITKRPIRITYRSDSTRSDKVFLKKLVRIETEINSPSEDFHYALRKVQEDFIFSKHLTKYYYDHALPDINIRI